VVAGGQVLEESQRFFSEFTVLCETGVAGGQVLEESQRGFPFHVQWWLADQFWDKISKSAGDRFGAGVLALDRRSRERFDRELEWVLGRLPPLVHDLIERVPLHVEDYPSREVMAETGARHRDSLCGLFTGIPLTERSIEHSGTLPEVVTIYREGILAAARDRFGRVRTGRLRREIRTTVLHELAHFHGLTEEELDELGYG
jgi:predicted Zn-dependent protease with MMP-like domain